MMERGKNVIAKAIHPKDNEVILVENSTLDLSGLNYTLIYLMG
jgi:hypothetical protein